MGREAVFKIRRHTVGVTLDAITAMAFQVHEFEHEGLELGIDSVSYCLFGGGLEALL